jgi:hypothetical protein
MLGTVLFMVMTAALASVAIIVIHEIIGRRA